MSVFKTLNSQDIIVSPFEVNKSFNFIGDSELLSYGIERYVGTNSLYDIYYNSIKQLYYSNYISGSEGEISNASTSSINIDGTLNGSVYSTLYDNYLSTDLNPQRYFPTSSEDNLAIISIPQNLFGDYIQPKSLVISTDSGSYIDDGEGRLIKSYYNDVYGRGLYGVSLYNDFSFINVGNIIYEHGIIIFTEGTSSINNIISSSNMQLSFSSSLTIYETQYKCTFNENEFNYTLNPSVTTGSDGKIYDHFTGSYFAPYITTVGLYNDKEELMAVGKLAQPLPTSRNTDTTILINIDRL